MAQDHPIHPTGTPATHATDEQLAAADRYLSIILSEYDSVMNDKRKEAIEQEKKQKEAEKKQVAEEQDAMDKFKPHFKEWLDILCDWQELARKAANLYGGKKKKKQSGGMSIPQLSKQQRATADMMVKRCAAARAQIGKFTQPNLKKVAEWADKDLDRIIKCIEVALKNDTEYKAKQKADKSTKSQSSGNSSGTDNSKIGSASTATGTTPTGTTPTGTTPTGSTPTGTTPPSSK